MQLLHSKIQQLNSYPAKNDPRRLGAGWIVLLVIFGGLCLLYGSTMPLDYTTANHGADGGDLLAAILTGGIPHPSGYPTYLLLGSVFQMLPFGGTPYFKGALLSLVFTALSAGLTAGNFLLIGEDTRPATILGALTAGLVLGTAPLLWSQAVIVEVYGLQAFFTACAIVGLALLLRGGEVSRRTDMGLCALAIASGLGVGNHLTILLLGPALVIALWVVRRGGTPWHRLAKYGSLALAATVLMYVALPLRASTLPPVNWGNPQTLAGLAWLVSGRMYQELVFGLPPAALLQRASAWANVLIGQAGIPGLFLGVLGAVQSFARPGVMKWILLWIFGIYSTFSIGYETNDSTAYLIPALMVFAIWIGMGVSRLFHGELAGIKIGRVLTALFIVFLLVRLPETRGAVDPRDDGAARAFALRALNSMPMGASVLTGGDIDTFVLWYYHFGLGWRPDLTLIAEGLTGFDWYHETLAASSGPGLSLPPVGANNWPEQLAMLNPGRPLCRSWETPLGFDCSIPK